MFFADIMSSEATQTTTVYDVLAWLETNKKPLIIAFVVAVLIGFGIAVYRWKSDQTELAASDALLGLKAQLGPGDVGTPTEAAAYLKVARDFPGTDAADRALLLAAGALFTEGKFTESKAQFSAFVHDRPQSPFAATAAYGEAVCVEALGKQDEALGDYQSLAVRFPNSSVLESAKLAAARILEAKNQPESALRIYDELSRSGGAGMAGMSSEALARKQSLLAKHPELAKTNAPPAAVSPSTNSAPVPAPVLVPGTPPAKKP